MYKIGPMASRRALDRDTSVLSCCTPLAAAAISDDDAREMSRIFGAMSDPARLRMLSLIASEDEVCSCALELPLAKSQSTISHHTKILADAGLIVGERRGRWTWWRVVPERLAEVSQLLSVPRAT